LKDIYIIGAGGNSTIIADTIIAINKLTPTFKLAGFIDDDLSQIGKQINGVEIICTTDDFIRAHSVLASEKPSAIISIANPQIKAVISQKLDGIVTWENIIHPTAQLSPYIALGIGVLVQAFVNISANTTIGNHTMINNHTSVGHDVILGDFVSVMVNVTLSGHVNIKEYGYLGSSATILPGITIGENACVGAGAVVTHDLPPNCTAIGVPAKIIR
jgi:sugar O-acyltransferase (sialic acid O-acetyltransferase NeuD family)